jgi:hypothetical protein
MEPIGTAEFNWVGVAVTGAFKFGKVAFRTALMSLRWSSASLI